MANEFGNEGALSQQRMVSKELEKSTTVTGAEYEAFYNGSWRDISSDFSYDTTKAGNTIARCIRWDDGFRSYRQDRGLIIRKKEEQEDQSATTSADNEDVGPIETFGRALGVGVGVNLTVQSYNNLIKPKIQPTLDKLFKGGTGSKIGGFLGVNKVALFFTGLTLVQDTGQSTSEKLKQAALSLGIGVAVRKLGPAGLFVGPAISIVEGLMTGAPLENILAGTAGNLAGRQVGRKISGNIFGTQGKVQTPSQKQGTGGVIEPVLPTDKQITAKLQQGIYYPYGKESGFMATKISQTKEQNITAAKSVKSMSKIKSLSKGLNRLNKKGKVF